MTVAYLLFGMAWIVSNPPGFAPDEPEHYLKALGMGQGELRGDPAPFTYLPVVDAQMLRWQNLNTRSVHVPAGMGACLYYRLPIYGRCPEGPPPPTPSRQTTYVASYPPFTYVGAAALMRLGHTTDTALLLGRAATLLLSAALAGGAAAALSAGRRRPALSLLGLLGSVSPMVVFTSSELSASGPEITSGICFAAGLIRLADEESPRRWLWPLLLFGGAVLALSRTFGPVWVVFDLCWATALVGVPGARHRLVAHRRWVLATATSISAAVAANLAWQIAVAPHPGLGTAAVRHGVRSVLGGIPHLGREAIGVFGWIDVPLPRLAYLLSALLLAALGVTGFVVAGRRQRLVLLGIAAGVGLLTLGVGIAIAASAPGFQMQTRYVLPVAVAMPLLAGEFVYRHRGRLSARLLRWAVPTALGVVALIQSWSLEVNAQFYRRNVRGLVAFITPPGWRPSLGWLPSIALAALGCAGLGALALLDFAASEPDATAAQVGGRPPV